MPSVLLVGDLSETATAALADRGYDLASPGTGDFGEGAPGSGDSGDGGTRDDDLGDGTPGGGLQPNGGAGSASSAVPDSVTEPLREFLADDPVAVDCALVGDAADDREAVEALNELAPELPVVYAVQAADAADAGAALVAGADDRVLLSGERDGDRIARRIENLTGDGVRGNGAVAPSRDTPGSHASTHDGRIGALLAGARDLMDAETPADVAETAVETAETALGYDVVAVRMVGDDGETLRPVATSSRADEVIGELPTEPLADSVVREAIEEGRSLELDAATLAAGDLDPLESGLVFPIGDHGIVGFGAVEPDAFGESDRHVGELLAANATAALDRIRRSERIESVYDATTEMLDARMRDGVARQAVDAARSILGHRFVVCYLEDEDGGGLEPIAWTDEADAITDGELPSPDEGDGATEAFRTETVVRRERGDDATAGTQPFASRLHVPIEGNGTLLIAATERDVFGESDVQIARLLATNTARTLERVSRTQELERLETVFETVNDMVYVHDEQGDILHCTPVLADRLGYDREEIIGINVADLVDEASMQEGMELIRELFDEPPGSSRTQRLDLKTGDGDEVPVELDISLLPGEEYRGVVGTVRDISDLLEVRERLDSQQDRFEYLFENIPDPVVEGYIEEEATVVSVNPAFEETFGHEESEIVGEDLNDVIVPEDKLERARALDRRSAKGMVNQTEVERDTPYGPREFLFRGVPYEAADGRMRGFGIYTDLTDQKERERHLEVLQRLLRHNVRNEVNVLLAAIDQLGDVQDDPGDREAELLETLDETAQDLLSMSQKAKRISRVIEAETDELGDVDLAAMTRSVVERSRQLDTDATVVADLPDSCHVLGSGAIERAIEELVGNAFQHAGPEPRVEVRLVCDEDGATLTVCDDGTGIPAAERQVLEAGEITPLRHGSGLGLWLVQHATAASGGTVSFDESADGASVTLSFRRAKGEP